MSHAKELGAQLSHVAHNVQSGIQSGNLPIPTSAMAPTIEHIGKYTVVVKHRLAEGNILINCNEIKSKILFSFCFTFIL